LNDIYDLRRFIEAQAQSYQSIVSELKDGQKCGHWMWYTFPQIQGLGASPMARHYAISSPEEAQAYLEHPILGSRLTECTKLVMDVEGRTAEQIFYYPDHLKFRSCLTLFDQCTNDDHIFRDALLKYFGGEFDQLTLDILGDIFPK